MRSTNSIFLLYCLFQLCCENYSWLSQPSGSRSDLVTSRSSPPHKAQHIEASSSGQQPPAANVRRTNGRGRHVMIARRYLRSENASTDVWATEVMFRECKNMPGPQVRNNRAQIYGIVLGVSSSASTGYTGAGKKQTKGKNVNKVWILGILRQVTNCQNALESTTWYF